MEGSSSTRSHVSRSTLSISNFVPCVCEGQHHRRAREVRHACLEQSLETFLGRLLLELPLLFGSEVARLLRSLYLLEDALELHRRTQR